VNETEYLDLEDLLQSYEHSGSDLSVTSDCSTPRQRGRGPALSQRTPTRRSS
jgi:hypothetical protein